MADFCLCSTSRRHLPQINYPPCSVPPPPEFSMRRLGTLRRKSGLSGLPLVLRIFTENSISLGPRRRQRGSRYTIRAGRYLSTRNFATLGQLELLPPFTGLPFKAYNTSPFDFPAPGRCRTLYIVLPLSRVLCF
uniref:Uncharacterized protein n=1 Tax=Brassica oleracea TaxID=3712 RepID=A0A3P6C2F3_BRAOL|nr:unnamed protein product [Brassica oleracea]